MASRRTAPPTAFSLLFVDRFAETAAHWRTLLADYRPDASAAPATATAPDAPSAFLPV